MAAFRKIRVVKTMAAEGNFHAHNLLRNGGRFFLFIKYLKSTLEYWSGSRHSAHDFGPSIVYIKGANQLRHFRETKTLIEARVGSVVPYSGTSLDPSTRRMAMVTTQDVFAQMRCLFLLLLTGRRRYLNMYYVAFYEGVRRSILKGHFAGVSNFICFNDQPYDIAALVLVFREVAECNTAVLQHGLILSPHFYFPTHVHEFWGWGEVSAEHFRGSFPGVKFVITGRKLDDRIIKSDEFIPRAPQTEVSFVIAPSHSPAQIKMLIAKVKKAQSKTSHARFFIKLHPATKLKALVRLWLRINAPWLSEVHAPMSVLSTRYDGLISVNSTSAVDFLLLGKPAFFAVVNEGAAFPSSQYGLYLDDLDEQVGGNFASLNSYNPPRLNFLREYLNV